MNKIKTNDIKPSKILPALDTAFASNSETNGVVVESCNFEDDVAEAVWDSMTWTVVDVILSILIEAFEEP